VISVRPWFFFNR